MAENENTSAAAGKPAAGNSNTGRFPGWLAPWVNWRYWRFRLLLAVALYTAGGFLLAPWLVERTVVSHFAETGRSASIGELRMNPYLFTLDLADFTLDDTDGQRIIGYDRLFVDFETRSIIDWAANFKLIQLDALAIFDERFEELDTRLVRLAEDLLPPEDTDVQNEPPPRVIIQRLEVTDARLDFLDGPANNFAGRIGPVSVEVDDIRTLPDHVGRQTVRIQINETDHLAWRGDLQLVPFRSSGQVELRGREVPNIRRYLDYYLPFDVVFGSISADFAYLTWVDEAGLGLELERFNGAISQLSLETDEANERLVTLDRVEMRDGRFALADRKGHVENIAVDGLGAEVIRREDGSINLLDLLPPPEPAPADGASDEMAIALSVKEVTVNGDGVNITDQTFTPALELGLRGLDIRLSDLDLEDDTAMGLRVDTQLASGGALGFEGAITAFPALRAEGRTRVDALALAVGQPLVSPIANVSIGGGTLNLTADLVHGPEQLLSLGGELSVDNFEVNDGIRDERLVAWRNLSLDRFEVNLAEERVETSVLAFQDLFGRLHIAEDRSTNVGDLLVDQGVPEGATAGEEAMALPAITIGGVMMEGTALDFSDFSLPLPFEAAIRDMSGEISTLATNSTEPATVALEGQVNEFGLARIDGSVNAWDPTRQTDIQMTFRNLEISRLSPYSIQFAGYAIEDGRLDTDLGYVFDERKMQGQNNIVIRDIQLGEKSDLPDAGSLPLGLAVALLKNSEGVIDLDVPVEGDLDNPEFKIGGVVMQAIGNLISRAVTAPFRLLGNLVGVDSEDFGVLSFQPGEAELSPPDREQLLKLSEAMAQRPELTVDIAGTWSVALDEPALRMARLDEQISGWQASNPGDEDELSTARDRRTLEALFQSAFPSEPLAAVEARHSAPPADDPEGDAMLDEPAYLGDLRGRLLESLTISQADFETLGRARSAAVLAALAPDPATGSLKLREVDPVELKSGDGDEAERGTVALELAVSAAD